ncbi:MAG: tRNA (adenosine(37)-N6)-threonylcarbamoyltransferase complex ATPase subunit type 1 TsaE [Gammaproteobacteria bacterium]|nr:tRNA (adenosine(37)-N6)-threonylcarbamoyltransferase complex ATPase subunit type 1 TsaE [Gammaproteobacteria bacterium]
MSVFLDSENELEAFATRLARASNLDLVIFLKGNLGAGKTTFARGFLRGSGYQGLVKSPTYTLVEPYSHDKDKNIYHFDLYRLSHGEELEFAGIRDYFDGQSACLIEWPEKAEGYLPEPDIICQLDYHGRGRNLRISAMTEKGEHVMLGMLPN